MTEQCYRKSSNFSHQPNDSLTYDVWVKNCRSQFLGIVFGCCIQIRLNSYLAWMIILSNIWEYRKFQEWKKLMRTLQTHLKVGSALYSFNRRLLYNSNFEITVPKWHFYLNNYVLIGSYICRILNTDVKVEYADSEDDWIGWNCLLKLLQ